MHECGTPGGLVITIARTCAYRLRPLNVPDRSAIAAAAARTDRQGHAIAYDVLGGQQGSAQFLPAFPCDSWAAFGKTLQPATRKMMESVYGKAASGALLHNMKHVLHGGGGWSGLWEYDQALSFLAGKR